MKLTIYGRKNCAWCEKAKTLAESLKKDGEIEDFIYIDYQEENLSKEDLFSSLVLKLKRFQLF